MVFLSRNHLESILLISFSIAAILITLPCEYKAEENGGGGGGTRATLVPTIIFDSLPPSTFHVFVLSLLFAFTSSLSALLMQDTRDNGTRNKSNYSQLLHVAITRCFGCSSLAFITSALAILFRALLLTATSSPRLPPSPPR
ncbi:hypothetical protein RHMOL_Rhmol06G0261300 [Rhododendron molle]|uniref:Uncharacterized protein n=1 Tax=Rhododendron molle TaxID=49168 RepID=A0ACC0NHM6_RHOML|nr:hypothetical protein RHMOL_Rhmol06G0261300 [Rhododendron molle]